MARGKYAARSAQRRATSAEDQLDRLLPELHEAKAIAKRYKSEAERAGVLAAQVTKLRETVGVPVEEHEAALAEAATAADLRECIAYNHLDEVIEAFMSILVPQHDPETNWINGVVIRTFRELPADRGFKILTSLGMDRAHARACLHGAAVPAAIAQAVAKDALNLGAKAKSAGLDGIPKDWVTPRRDGSALMPAGMTKS